MYVVGQANKLLSGNVTLLKGNAILLKGIGSLLSWIPVSITQGK
jgi:hypothetical protein